MKQATLVIVLALVSSVCFGMSVFRSNDLYLASFEGKVIDSETKEPIEGAAVLAIYHGGSLSVAGSGYFPVDAQEALTDANGSFRIPARTVKSEKATGKAPGNILIFKPGYGTFPNHKRSEAVGENKSWPTAEKHIIYELPRLATKEDRTKNVFDIGIKYALEFNKQKAMVDAVNAEFKKLGIMDRYVEKDGKPFLEAGRQVR